MSSKRESKTSIRKNVGLNKCKNMYNKSLKTKTWTETNTTFSTLEIIIWSLTWKIATKYNKGQIVNNWNVDSSPIVLLTIPTIEPKTPFKTKKKNTVQRH